MCRNFALSYTFPTCMKSEFLSRAWIWNINFTEPQITKFPSDTIVTEGEGVYFRIKVSGEPQPTVTWYHDGEPVRADYAREIESDGSLTIPSTELKHSGVYKAVAANSHGSMLVPPFSRWCLGLSVVAYLRSSAARLSVI